MENFNNTVNSNDFIKLAGIQLLCNQPRLDMLDKAERYIDELFQKHSNIDLLVLPEQFYQLEANQSQFKEKIGEKEGQEFEKWASNIASRYGVNLVAGTYQVVDETVPANHYYNRAVVFDRFGEKVGKYDKIHLFDAYGVKESDTYCAGSNLAYFDLDIGRIGIMICYDIRFPEISRALALNNIDLFVIPAAFYKPNDEHWQILLKSIAISNITPVIAINQSGDLPNGKGFLGHSMIINANGDIISEYCELSSLFKTDSDNISKNEFEGYVIGEISKKETNNLRNINPCMNNRRPDLYKNWF